MEPIILKKKAAQAALAYLKGWDIVLGVGSGSTVNCFIDALISVKSHIEVAVASSEETARRLKALNIPVVSLNDVGHIDVYVDGADEINAHLQMIKGGGAALTREKIVAQAAKQFVCIADQSKLVDCLGKFPLPVEVIPMARSAVARAIRQLGGAPAYREGVVTDNGNVILDVYGLTITNAVELEKQLNNIPGIVTNGIFAIKPANILLLASADGVQTFFGN